MEIESTCDGEFAPIRPYGRAANQWLFSCDCGLQFVAKGNKIIKPPCKGYGVAAMQRTMQTWHAMINRCTKPDDTNYKYYGGRGITVCGKWLDFWAFISDMGPRPEDRSIDRIDNGGNYEPGNCRWATASEQASNRRARQKREIWDHPPGVPHDSTELLALLKESLRLERHLKRTKARPPSASSSVRA